MRRLRTQSGVVGTEPETCPICGEAMAKHEKATVDLKGLAHACIELRDLEFKRERKLMKANMDLVKAEAGAKVKEAEKLQKKSDADVGKLLTKVHKLEADLKDARQKLGEAGAVIADVQAKLKAKQREADKKSVLKDGRRVLPTPELVAQLEKECREEHGVSLDTFRGRCERQAFDQGFEIGAEETRAEMHEMFMQTGNHMFRAWVRGGQRRIWDEDANEAFV